MSRFIRPLKIGIATFLMACFGSAAHAQAFEGLWHTTAPGLEPALDTSGMMSLKISKSDDGKFKAQFIHADRVPSDPGNLPSLRPINGRLSMLVPGMWPIPSGGRYFKQPVKAEITSIDDGSSLDVTLTDTSGYTIELRFYPDNDTRFDQFKYPRLGAGGTPVTDYKYSTPSSVSSGFTVSTPKKEGISRRAIEKAVTAYISGKYSKRPGFLLIVRNGKLVLEEYFFGATPDRLWLLHSDSKSITSLLAGIAADEGAIDINEPINKYFPEYADSPWMKSTQNTGVTPRHLLFMANVIGWADDGYVKSGSRFNKAFSYPGGFTEGVLQYPVITTDPDPYFNYNTHLTNLLGETVARATGQHLSNYLQDRLLTPLGEERSFFLTESGVEGDPVEAGSTVGMRPIAMAKIGQLMLNRGDWDGKQVVSSKWVAESTSVTALKPNPSHDGYGYQWWHRKYKFKSRKQPVRMVFASGRAGQFICILPDFNAAIVTGALDFTPGGTTRQFNFIEQQLLSIFNDGTAVEKLEFGPEDLGVKVLN